MERQAAYPIHRPAFVALAPPRQRRDPQPLWLWVILIVVTFGPLFLLLTNEGHIPDAVRAKGGLLWLLSMAPAIVYFATPLARRPPVPALPIIGVLFGMYYGLQLLLGTPNASDLVNLDPTTDYLRATDVALVGWVALLIGSALASLLMRMPAAGMRKRWAVAPLKRWAFIMQFGGFVLDVARLELPVPLAIRGLLNFAGMVALFGTGILIVLSMRGHLSMAEKVRLWAFVGAIAIVQITTGSVANLGRVAVVVLLAYWIAGAKLRLSLALTAILLALAVMILRGFAIDYRLQAWSGEELSTAERTGVWYNLVRDHAQENGMISVVGHGATVFASRTANLDLLADVVRQTPRSVPFWGGQTYLSLVGAFVPRFLWPSKPQKQLGQDFGHRYGYLHVNDRATSINLPFVVEFYANFGETGVMIGMVLVGGILALLDRLLNNPRQDWVRSLCGVVLLVPIVTNIESDFSLVFGGVILNGFALYLVYRFLKRRCVIRNPASAPRRLVRELQPDLSAR